MLAGAITLMVLESVSFKGHYVAFGGYPFVSTGYGYAIASKVLKWTDLLMMGQSFQLFPEHLSRRDRRIVWLAQDNSCREIKTCAVIRGSYTLGIYFCETTKKSLRNAKRRNNNTNVCS